MIPKKSCSQPSHKNKVLPLFFIWRLSQKPLHGYSLALEMQNLSLDFCKPATVYAILTKLEKRGFIAGRQAQKSGRSRKIYHTTQAGRKLFEKVKREKIKGILREFFADLSA
ncbi:MAG: PadR family transcriptional regulator [Candidatus Micrarchaeota archaeon]